MRRAASALPSDISADASIGGVLAAALLASDLKRCSRADQPACVPRADLRAAGVLALSLDEASRACDGLCAPARMRAAATLPLSQLVSLLRRVSPQPQHEVLAAALRRRQTAPPAGVRGEDLCAEGVVELLRMWDVFKLDPSLQSRRGEVGVDFTLKLAHAACPLETSRKLRRRAALLQRPGPSLNGKALAGLSQVPPHLRSQVIAQVRAASMPPTPHLSLPPTSPSMPLPHSTSPTPCFPQPPPSGFVVTGARAWTAVW